MTLPPDLPERHPDDARTSEGHLVVSFASYARLRAVERELFRRRQAGRLARWVGLPALLTVLIITGARMLEHRRHADIDFPLGIAVTLVASISGLYTVVTQSRRQYAELEAERLLLLQGHSDLADKVPSL